MTTPEIDKCVLYLIMNGYKPEHLDNQFTACYKICSAVSVFVKIDTGYKGNNHLYVASPEKVHFLATHEQLIDVLAEYLP